MLPVIDSNIRADALAREVLPHYDVGDPVQCRLYTRGLNDTYKVETSRSGSYFLRVYRAGWRGIDEIETELAMLRHLARQGASVSLPVARRDEEILTSLDCAEGRRWAALFTAAPGKEIANQQYTEEQAVLYGEAAGAIHHASESFAGRWLRPPLDLVHLLDRPLTAVASALSHRAADASYIVELGVRLRGRITGAIGLEIGFCHGDLHGQNANEAAGTLTFYDFDCCGWGYRAYDVAVFPWVSFPGPLP